MTPHRPAAAFIILVALLLTACVSAGSGQNVCPEYRNLICAGQPVCEPDLARGCSVCICPGESHEDPSETDPHAR